MVARVVGASLGLLAFTVTIVAGLYVQNPATVTLSRGVLALFVFCVLGLVLGGAAQIVINEHRDKREEEIRAQYREEPVEPNPAGLEEEAVDEESASPGT
jgi:hypothetical protein